MPYGRYGRRSGYRGGFRPRGRGGYYRFGARRRMGFQPRRRAYVTRRVRFGGRRW